MQNDSNRQYLLFKPRIVGFIVAFILLILTATISGQLNNHYNTELRGKVTIQLNQIQSNIENEINRLFYLSKGLVAYVALNPKLDSVNFVGMSKEILRDSLPIKSINLAPNNIISYIYPLKENEKDLGLDLSKNTKQWPVIKAMIADKKSMLDGPIDLIQGGKVFINRTPIFVTSSNENKEKYWGIANTVIEVDQLLESAGINDFNDSIRISLHKKAKNGLEINQIFGDDNLFNSEPEKLIFNIPGGSMVLKGVPKQGWNQSTRNHYVLWLFGFSLASLSGWIVMIRLKISAKRKLQLETALNDSRLADKAKSDFVANMSHEIRTPLNPIISLTYLALKDDLPTQTQNYLKEIQSASQLLLKIIDSVLDFSKIEAGKMTIEKLPFCLDQFLKNLTNLYSDQAQENKLSFSIQLSQDLPSYIVGDARRLGQVLGNLLSNAFKFTRKGSINLSVQVINQSDTQVGLSFVINDTGIGMTSEQLQQLFQEFNQSDSSITREFGGTGLGLSICQKLIHLMDGEIYVESSPNIGSQFTCHINFDIASEEMISKLRSKTTLPMQQLPSYEGETVLLVEDNITNQVVVQKLLKGTGLKVYIANNGQEAVFMSLARVYDIVLMDIQMPVMDGYKAAETIRQKKRYENTPIIAMTAHALRGDRNKSIEAGMSDHISKPIDPEAFYQTLMRWLPAKGTVPHLTINTADNLWPLNDLPGIDANVGLKKFLQDQELYQKVLIEFHQDHMKDADIFKQSLKNNDKVKAKRLAHTIKGAAGHLGATALFQATIELEAGLKNNKKLDECFYKFQLTLDEVLSGIAQLKKQFKNTNEIIQSENKMNNIELAHLIQGLLEKLLQASPQASELIPDLSLALGQDYKQSMDDLQEMVDTFDFDEALKIVKKIKNHIV